MGLTLPSSTSPVAIKTSLSTKSVCRGSGIGSCGSTTSSENEENKIHGNTCLLAIAHFPSNHGRAEISRIWNVCWIRLFDPNRTRCWFKSLVENEKKAYGHTLFVFWTFSWTRSFRGLITRKTRKKVFLNRGSVIHLFIYATSCSPNIDPKSTSRHSLKVFSVCDFHTWFFVIVSFCFPQHRRQNSHCIQ